MFILPGRRLQTAAFMLFVLGGVPTARGSFTLEQVMSSPFPTELVTSPSGGRAAWVFEARGLRNIWVAEPGGGGGYVSRQLTRYTQDDGQEIGELTWTPDGRAILYVRAGDFETGGPYPNPASAPEGVETGRLGCLTRRWLAAQARRGPFSGGFS